MSNTDERAYDVTDLPADPGGLVAGVPQRMAAWVGRQVTLLLYLLPPVLPGTLSRWLWELAFHQPGDALIVGFAVYCVLVWASLGAGPPTVEGIVSHLLTVAGLFASLLLAVAATGAALILWRGWAYPEACWAMSAVGAMALFVAFGMWDAVTPPAPWHPNVFDGEPSAAHLRGAVLESAEGAQERADALRPPSDPGLIFGGVRIPARAANLHFLFLGSTGSGKTLSLLLLLKDALRDIGTRQGHNGIIFDGKGGELLPFIPTLAPEATIHILNPADRRATRWALHRDIRTEAQAIQFAAILFEDNASVRASGGGGGGNDEFFRNSARDVVVGVLMVLIERNIAWNLRDLVLLLRDEDRTQEILSLSPGGRRRLQYFRHDQRSGHDVLATIRAKFAELGVIAAWWQHATDEVSLKDWVRSRAILVLGTTAEASTAISPINQLIFKFASDLILAQPNSERRRHWIIMDEAREAGAIDIRSLALRGRSKGACIAYSLQDTQGMASLYRREGAAEILGQFRHCSLLALSGIESQKHASDLLGVREELLYLRTQSTSHGETGGISHTSGPQASTTTSSSTTRTYTAGTNESLMTRPAVLASEFGEIGLTTFETGLRGYYKSPVTGGFGNTLSGEFLREHLPKAAPDTPEFVPRPDGHGKLAEFTHADCLRLGLRPDPEDREGGEPVGFDIPAPPDDRGTERSRAGRR